MFKALLICFLLSAQYLGALAGADDYEKWKQGFEERNIVLLSKLIIKLKNLEPTAEEYIEKLAPFEKQPDSASFDDLKTKEEELLEVCDDMHDWINYSTEECNYHDGSVECCVPEGYSQSSTTPVDDMAKRTAFMKGLVQQKKDQLSQETKALINEVNTEMRAFMSHVNEKSNATIKDVKELEGELETICNKYKDKVELKIERCFSSQGFANCCVPEYGRFYNVLGPGTRREPAATYGKYRPGPDYEFFVATKFND